MNLSKAQDDVMEIMDSINNKASQKTDSGWVLYVKMGKIRCPPKLRAGLCEKKC